MKTNPDAVLVLTLSYDGSDNIESLIEARRITIGILLEDGTKATSLQVGYSVDVIAFDVSSATAPSFTSAPDVNTKLEFTVGVASEISFYIKDGTITGTTATVTASENLKSYLTETSGPLSRG